MERHRHALITALILLLAGCASGSAIVTGTAKTPIAAEHVTLYVDPPAEYETIGLVNASSTGDISKQESVNHAIQELKAQAGKIGANGVVLISSQEGATENTMEVQGKAIFVTKK